MMMTLSSTPVLFVLAACKEKSSLQSGPLPVSIKKNIPASSTPTMWFLTLLFCAMYVLQAPLYVIGQQVNVFATESHLGLTAAQVRGKETIID